MTRLEKRKRIAELISEARNKHSVTQMQIAELLGVSIRTVQSWEYGESSVPFEMVIDWFTILNEPLAPSLKRYLFGTPYKSTKKNREQLIEEAIGYINNMTNHEIECFDYIFSGVHGSSPMAYLQKTVCDLQSPIGNRLATCVLISTNYQGALMRGELTNPDSVQPNLDVLNDAITKATEAFHAKENSYTPFKE